MFKETTASGGVTRKGSTVPASTRSRTRTRSRFPAATILASHSIRETKSSGVSRAAKEHQCLSSREAPGTGSGSGSGSGSIKMTCVVLAASAFEIAH